MSERNIANSRVTELEERIAALEKEDDVAKQEAAAAIQRAEKAEENEQVAAKQEEDLAPRVAAVVNYLTGNLFLPLLPCLYSWLFRPINVSPCNFCRGSRQPTQAC